MINLGRSLYLVRHLLPVGVVNRIRRFWNKRSARKRSEVRRSAIERQGTFDTQDLVRLLTNEGVVEGGILFVHCAFGKLYTFAGTPLELLGALRTSVGDAGTLLFPAYSSNTGVSPSVFDVGRDATYTGLVSELFRRAPGVFRSLHPRHSICGEGPLAESLLTGHEKCVRADGPDSPFDRLRFRDDAQILTLGLPPGHISFLHWVEDLEPEKLPFRVHDSRPTPCCVRDLEGREIEVLDWRRRPSVTASLNIAKIARRLSSEAMRDFEHKSVSFVLYGVKPLARELLALRDAGIIHYR